MLTLAQANSQFSQRSASAVLIIPADFDLAHLEQGSLPIDLREQPNNMNAMVAQRAVEAVISRVSSAADVANQSVAAAEAIQPFAIGGGPAGVFQRGADPGADAAGRGA